MKTNTYPPLKTDLPRKDLIALAETVKRDNPTAKLHFKYTCCHCGVRMTLSDADTLWTHGTCAACGNITEITHGGFMLVQRLDSAPNPNN